MVEILYIKKIKYKKIKRKKESEKNNWFQVKNNKNINIAF